jgi:hypothetical protein
MKILIVSKYSKLEWDSKQLGIPADQLVNKYQDEGANHLSILAAHNHQWNVRNWFKDKFWNADFIMLSELEKKPALAFSHSKYDLILALGGDNSFTRISHFLEDTPILGVNNDPERSAGCLTSFKVDSESSVVDLKTKLRSFEYTVEEWPRIEATVNGEAMRLATSEVFLGERLRKNMSRHIFENSYNPVAKAEHKCSGMIICNGAGSTGWNRSAGGQPFKKTDGYLHWLLTEPYQPAKISNFDGWIKEDEYLKITSLNDDGIISIDSWDERAFNRGTVAEVRLGNPLKVLIPNADQNQIQPG